MDHMGPIFPHYPCMNAKLLPASRPPAGQKGSGERAHRAACTRRKLAQAFKELVVLQCLGSEVGAQGF